MQKFHRQFEKKLHLVASYFVTAALYENKVTIVVGADNCHRLELPTEYDEYPVFVDHNHVQLARRTSNLADIHTVKLTVGADIGRKNHYDNFGTLGGFVRVDDEIMAMTCHHVVKNNFEFTQPSFSSVADLIVKKKSCSKCC